MPTDEEERMVPFKIAVADEVLEDLRDRIQATRWPAEMPDTGWAYGIDMDVLRDLVEYWGKEYDWRRHERRLNGLHQYRTDLDGLGIHFVHERGRGPDPFPLVLTHGWPSSFVEMEKLIPLLTQPDDPADAFDVVVPSLPGYGFSDPPGPGQAVASRTAARWATLMRDVLGYPRFGAVGGDVGAGVTVRLGMNHTDGVVGIHLDPDGITSPADLDKQSLSPEERAYVEAEGRWETEEGGYAHLQGTRPRTVAFGLNDSPAGLAAYIVEKYRAWSDCGGDVYRRFTRDELLTTVTLYWVTGSIGSSFLPYYDYRHQASPQPAVHVPVPVAVALWREPELSLPPRQYAQRTLNVTRWTHMPRGGHFAATEEPELLADDIREFFRPLR
jgi:pimeloyl-ACP methyl ester carboxylesterase